MKFHKIQFFKLQIENFFLVPVYMGHGLAILNPFSRLSRPKVTEFLFKIWKPSLQ